MGGTEPAKQQARLVAALRRSLFQPVPRLARFAVLRLAVELPQLQLSLAVPGSGSLAQQLEADATVTLAVTVVTEQTPEATLRFDHALQRRLLEHLPGDPLDAAGLPEALIVE